jgi:hypothetical protein
MIGIAELLGSSASEAVTRVTSRAAVFDCLCNKLILAGWCYCCIVQVPSDEPVWRQVLRHQLDHSDPAVAQHAAAALAELTDSS